MKYQSGSKVEIRTSSRVGSYRDNTFFLLNEQSMSYLLQKEKTPFFILMEDNDTLCLETRLIHRMACTTFLGGICVTTNAALNQNKGTRFTHKEKVVKYYKKKTDCTSTQNKYERERGRRE